MTQDEKWQTQYDEIVAFINKNHRNPSKYVDEERGLVNWCKHQRKIINASDPNELQYYLLYSISDKIECL